MSKKTKLTAAQYIFLHNEKIMQKFGKYCESQNVEIDDLNVKQRYGYNSYKDAIEYDKDLPNLQRHIIEDMNFDLCIENNIEKVNPKSLNNIGKQVYYKYLKAEKDEYVSLSGVIYTKALFKYLDYEDVNDFIQQYESNNPKPSIIETDKKEVQIWTEYLGFLCSTRIEDSEVWKRKGIRTFILKLGRKHYVSDIEEYNTEVQITDEVERNIPYTGVSTHKNHNLNVVLTSSENRDLNFFFATNGSTPTTIELMRGMYLDVCKFTIRTISGQAIIVRKDKANKNAVRSIKQYLRTNHAEIRVGRQTFLYKDIVNQKNQRNSSLKLSDLIGTHWWIDKSYDGILDLSKLIVTPDLESYVEYKVTKEQIPKTNPCFITFNRNFMYVKINELGQLSEGDGKHITIGYAVFKKNSNANYPYFIGKQLVNGHRETTTFENVVLIKKENHFEDIETGFLGNEDRKWIIRFLLEQQSQFEDCFEYLLERTDYDLMRQQELKKQQKLFDDILAEIE